LLVCGVSTFIGFGIPNLGGSTWLPAEQTERNHEQERCQNRIPAHRGSDEYEPGGSGPEPYAAGLTSCEYEQPREDLVEVARPYKWLLGAAVLSMLLTTGANLTGPWITRELVALLTSRAESGVVALNRVNESLQNAVAGGERVFDILDTEVEVQEQPGARDISDVEGEIYIDDNEVLEDISFTVAPGEMYALVGPTRVGKTTIVSLIPRFYDPDEGSIRIDGVDIREVTLRSLRSQISMVLQDAFLFNGTVAENISYGKPTASRDEIVEAARTRADEFIWDCQTATTPTLASGGSSAQVDRSSGFRLPGRYSVTPPSSYWTRPLQPSIRRPRPSSRRLSRSSWRGGPP